LEVFDIVQLADYLITIKPAIVSALGHKKDVTLVEQIADKKLATPSAFGAYLKDIFEQISRDLNKSEAQITKRIELKFENVYRKRIDALSVSNKKYEELLSKTKDNQVKLQNHYSEQIKALNTGNQQTIKSINENNEKNNAGLNSQLKNIQSSLKQTQDSFKTTQNSLVNSQREVTLINGKLSAMSSKLTIYAVIALAVGLIVGFVISGM